MMEDQRKSIYIGAVLFVLGAALTYIGNISLLLIFLVFVASYLASGWPILMKAAQNLSQQKVFNAYVLYSIATLGAFLLGDPFEAAGIMLLFRLGKIFENIEIEAGRDRIQKALDAIPQPIQPEKKPRADLFLTIFARVYTAASASFAALIAIIPSILSGNWHYWIYAGLTFLVISHPRALLSSVPMAFFAGIGIGAKNGIQFKGKRSLEALAKIKTVAFNKTGTLTQGHYVLDRIVPAGHFSPKDLLRISASCERDSTHPIALSIIAAAKEQGIPLLMPASVKEFPGRGILCELSFGEILCGNRKLMEMHSVSLENWEHGLFDSEILVAVNGVFAGCLFVSESIRPDAKKSIHRLRQMGMNTALLTGDTWDSARFVAKETGIQEVFARLLPGEKVEELGNIRKRRGAVMFVGDGIEDAQVMVGADVSCALGKASDIAMENADLVLPDASLETLPRSITIARDLRQTIMLNIILALSVKFAIIALGLLGFASLWLAVLADLAVTFLCILNSVRLYSREEKKARPNPFSKWRA